MGYEVRDLNVKAIRNATIGFFLFAAGSFVIGWWVYNAMNPAMTLDYQRTPDHRRMPPANYPLLQNNVTAKTDIMALRQAESLQLKTTGYTDASRTAVHIPIDRAMDLIATQGLKPTGLQIEAVTKGNTTDQKRMPTDVHVVSPLAVPPKTTQQ